MPKVQFTDSDVRSGYLIESPNWILYRVKSCTEKTSKAGDSTNYFLVVVGIEGEMKDVEVVKMYNSKLIKLSNRFFMAAGGEEMLVAGKDYDFNDYTDVILEGYTERGEQDGNPINLIKDWRPAQKIK